MVSKTVTLFILAATVAFGRVIQRPKSHPHQMILMPAWTGSPDHYPLHIAPSYIEPAVKCDDPQPEIGPLPIAEKPLVSQAPVSVAVPIPHFPAPVMVGTNSLLAEPCEPALVPETTAMDIPAANALPVMMPVFSEIPQPEPWLDEVVAIPQQPMVVPQPPELPAFVMPELPEIEVPMPEPCLEDQPIPVPEYVPPPMPLPVVEPVFVPEMPVQNIPVAPALPPLEMPVLPEIVKPEPCIHEEIVPENPQPILIPQAPELPAFVMPDLPVRVEVPIPEAPAPEYIPLPMPIEEPTVASIPELPKAPELPTVAMPVFPEIVALPEPCLEEIVVPEVNYLPIVPQPPELPALVMPELPVKVEAPIPKPIFTAPAPEYIPLPAPMPLPIELTPEVSYQPTVIPQAPKLPVYVVPELPARDPMIAPCPEDIPYTIPGHVQHLPLMPIPELPTAPLPKDPVRVEISSPIIQPEDPCVEELALVVPQLSMLPEPIIPARPEPAVDPCEPSAKPAMMAFPPYFINHPYYMQTNGFYPGRDNLIRHL